MRYFLKPLVLAGALLAVLPACDLISGGGSCGNIKNERYYDVEGVTLSAFQNGVTSSTPVTTGATVASAQLQLLLKANLRYYSHAQPSAGFLPAAVACSPAEPGYDGTAEQADTLKVISRFAYDAQHPAGSSLNDILLAEDFSAVTLTQHIQNTTTGTRSITLWYPLKLRLRTPPAQAGPQQFIIRYHQTNGEAYSAQTPEFVLTP